MVGLKRITKGGHTKPSHHERTYVEKIHSAAERNVCGGVTVTCRTIRRSVQYCGNNLAWTWRSSLDLRVTKYLVVERSHDGHLFFPGRLQQSCGSGPLLNQDLVVALVCGQPTR
jgi:hypothetical protein